RFLIALPHKVFGSKNERELKKLRPLVEEINRFEPEFASLSPEALQAKTSEFRSRIQTTTHDLRTRLADLQARLLSEETQDNEPDEGREALKEEADKLEKELLQAEAEVIDALLPQAFAAVREASRRTTGMRHFDSQLIGAMVLHHGKIAEMKTGEGKTLVATAALYLNSLEGKGAHLVTVNDYLARRDVQWMGPIYHHLGLSVGIIQHETSFLFDPTYDPEDKRLVYLRPR